MFNKSILVSAALLLISSQASYAAIALDRTRVVYNESDKSISLNISNENKQLPYLVQAWIEDENGKKINSPITVVPPLQRIEAQAKSQVRLLSLPAISALPKDRETVFYFNLREIPPRSDKPNTLQIALQTKVKLFFRPKSIVVNELDRASPWQEKLVMEREGNKYLLKNPTPYYITIVSATTGAKKEVDEFTPLMIAPFSSDYINAPALKLGDSPILTYINDYGGHPQLSFQCSSSKCTSKPIKN